MKIYFSATITKDPALKDLYKIIVDTLQQEGHTVLEYGSEKLQPEDLVNRSEEAIKNVYRDLDKYLKNSDVLIADISTSSVGIGYEISQALTLKKPVLALKYQMSGFEPLATLEGNKSSYLTYKLYNEKNIEATLKNFLIESKEKINTKFILIISPEIDRYLEWNARERGKAKAEVTRDAIENIIKTDKKYQEFLKASGFGELQRD